MTRLDFMLARRMGWQLGGALLVFFGLIAMSEALDIGRFSLLSETRGEAIAILAVVTNAARWSIKVLPVTVLIGSILALLDLRRHNELAIMQVSGHSIWQILRGPALLIIVCGLIISFALDGAITRINRSILPAPASNGTILGPDTPLWLEQSTGEVRYFIQANRVQHDNRVLANATFFLPSGGDPSRIEAKTATFENGQWRLGDARLISATSAPRQVKSFLVPTTSKPADLQLKLASTDDFTLRELGNAMATGISDPSARSAAAMRFDRLLALPALLVGSLLIAFAFTAGYRRQGAFGRVIVYGIMLGFVVFVITEMADRAGSAGVLDPAFAAWGPAIVAIVIGLTVLLYKEDGRA